jgi:hypothetical protein
MLDNFIFENHLGQRFVGLDNGVYLNESELRDYSWSYDTINRRISRFYHDMKERKIPLVVKCSTVEEANHIKNLLHEMGEKDIAALIPGTIYVGDYYTKGYISASSKAEYLDNPSHCKLDLTLLSEDPRWYRETTHVFLPGETETVSAGSGTDYPYDYPYDYALSQVGRRIMCDTVTENSFKLNIYGPAVNPSVNVGGHTYAVSGSLLPGESLLIDSIAKTITLTTATGGKVNWFDKRGRDSYIFQPIPAGVNAVSWVGGFGFDLTVVEERSEPRWT